MKFNYEDLISGEPIFVEGVGHLRSPYLRELKPTTGIGYELYSMYLSILEWDKNAFIKLITMGRNFDKEIIEKLEQADIFDLAVLKNQGELLRSAMAFFIVEEIEWNHDEHVYIVKTKEDAPKIVGCIDRDNFEEVRKKILALNYIEVKEPKKAIKHSSQKSKELWEQTQQFLAEQKTKTAEDRRYVLGNIISKLCAADCGYTLLNIYDLTIYQLYDQFFQYGYLRATGIGEAMYSHWGGDKFDYMGWLNPILEK